MKVGFIGLGNVGGKLASSLLRNKFDLTVIDLDSSLTKDFLAKGASASNSPFVSDSIDTNGLSIWLSIV